MDAEQTTPPTAPSLGRVTIKNFKSIKEVAFDTRRINLFVGRPNTGKSNILEAVSLLGATKSISSIRFHKIRDLFYGLNDDVEIEIASRKTSIIIRRIESSYFLNRSDVHLMPLRHDGVTRTQVLENGDFKEPFSIVVSDSEVPEAVVSDLVWLERFYESVAVNLIVRALRRDKNLYSVLESIVDSYGFQIAFYGDDFVLSQKKGGEALVLIPFSMISDTMRRLFFYFSLISLASNRFLGPDYVLLLEEPEVHSYPPYIKTLAEKISSAKTNQFFIATHSPYLLETLYENAEDDELQVFVVDYQNHQTVVQPVDNEALGELIDNRADVFFNLHNLVS